MASVEQLLQSDLIHRGITFTPPNGAKVRLVPAHPDNYDVSRPGQPRKHLGITFHSTEGYNSENWFANKNAGASTPWIIKDDEIVHCVPEDYVAYAQGTYSNKRDRRFNDKLVRDGGRPSWMPAPPVSYNTFLEGLEIEGFAAKLHKTLIVDGPQWENLASLTGFLFWKHDIAEGHCKRHMDLCFKKSDPGDWFGTVMPQLIEEAVVYKNHFEQQAVDLTKPVAASVPNNENEFTELREQIAQNSQIQTIENQLVAVRKALR